MPMNLELQGRRVLVTADLTTITGTEYVIDGGGVATA